MPRTLRLLAWCLLSLALVACGDDSQESAARHEASRTDGALLFTVSTSRAVFGFSETVDVVATIQNTSEAPVTISWDRGSPPRFSNVNINIEDTSGVDHFIDGDSENDSDQLAAGQTLTYAFDWDQVSRTDSQPVGDGVYEVKVFTTEVGGARNWPQLFISIE